jgi:hypothetical protein
MNFRSGFKHDIVGRLKVAEDHGIVRKVEQTSKGFNRLRWLNSDLPCIVGYKGAFWLCGRIRFVVRVARVAYSEHIPLSKINVVVWGKYEINRLVEISHKQSFRNPRLSKDVTGFEALAR